MASTYATNSGMELIGSGDQTGIWGTTTNTNLQIIDRLTNGVGAVSVGTGTTYTLTTSSAGALSEGQYKVLVLGGTPSATNTVTISPNTAQHMYLVKNNTARSIILTQGTGGTVTLTTGTSKIVYCDGAGATAAVVDLTSTFALSSATITGGSITGLSSAIPVASGGTGVTTSTGSGANVLGTGPTITSGVYSGTVGASSPSTGAFTTATASTSVLSSGTGGVGYATGAGTAVTQLTSRTTSTPTTSTKKSGAITLFTTTAVVGTYFSFTVPNTGIAVTDTVVLSVRGATNTYVASVTAITAATSFQITMASVVGTASDTPIVNFTIIKGVSA